MSVPIIGLMDLVPVDDRNARVARPPSHWKSRLLVPFGVLGSTAALLAFSARTALIPITDVWVTPVIAAPRPLSAAVQADAAPPPGRENKSLLVQAPGWVEPAPYPVSVPSLIEGFVRDVFVLEGESVTKGQILVRLVDEDARLAVESADADLHALQAEVVKAQAEAEAAKLRVEETRDQLHRAIQLVEKAGGSEADRAQLAIRLRAEEQNVKALEAGIDVARAKVRQHEVMCEEARLALSRTQIVAPMDGVVLARLVEPGTRISMAASRSTELMSGAIIRLYDPSKLQVRVEIPIAEVAKVRVGTKAEILTEALPDVVFHGKIVRVVHEANIQRNTVQVKVAIENPDEILKPEMLVRVKFYGAVGETKGDGGGALSEKVADHRLLLLESALTRATENRVSVWVARHDPQSNLMVVQPVEIEVRPSDLRGFVEVTAGLHEGDRIVLPAPENMNPGGRVRIVGERTAMLPENGL